LLRASEQILSRVFDLIDKKDHSRINWTEFLSAMMILKCGTVEEKMDLFFRMYDDNCNGYFEFSEVKALFLTKVLDLQVKHDETAEDIAEAFTKSLFRTAGVEYD
jgi:Ca2+-binding EF-hand superfamily protein